MQDFWGETPLTKAAWNGDLVAVDALLAHGASADFPTRTGAVALRLAALQGHTAVVSYLLDHGADVNRR